MCFHKTWQIVHIYTYTHIHIHIHKYMYIYEKRMRNSQNTVKVTFSTRNQNLLSHNG